MIDSIRLQNYKGHSDTTIHFARLTVLVGENACGKSSVLELLHRTSEGLPDHLPIELLRHGGDALAWTVHNHDDDDTTTITARYEPATGSPVLHATVREVTTGRGEVGRRPQAMLVALSPQALAASSKPESAHPSLGPQGEGLASVLAHLKLTDEPRFRRIVERLQRVVPIVRGLGFARVSVTSQAMRTIQVEGQRVAITEMVPVIHDALRFDFVDAPAVPAAQVSEGTLLTLGILTALETVERTRHIEAGQEIAPVRLALLDDLDRALHPRAQRELIAALRKVLDETPDLQIVATSHSPYLVDTLRPEEVVVLGRMGDGTITAKRLDAFPDARLKAMLSTGELWMSEGESWVAQ